VQGAGEKTPVIGTIDCWHCGKKGHYKTSCPELQIDEGVQNLSIEDSVQEHSLFSTDNNYKMLQKEETGVCRWANGRPQNSSGPFGYLATPPMSRAAVKPQGQKGLHGILSPHHVYIDTCASYASTPYPHLLKNPKKDKCALVGHSNMGSGEIEMSGEMGAVEQMWLNEGGVVSIIPLKVLEKIWPESYDSRRNGGVSSSTLTKEASLSRTTARECPTSTSGTWRQRWHCRLSRRSAETWKGTCRVRLKMPAPPVRPKPCWAIRPTATSWEWYVPA
jgi:hypothetical protein